MIDLKEMFPKFYEYASLEIPRHVSLVSGDKLEMAHSSDEKIRQAGWDYIHDYLCASADGFRSFDLPNQIDRFPEELARYVDQHPTFDYDTFCEELEEALKNDTHIQTYIRNLMFNLIAYGLLEEPRDIVIRNSPIEFTYEDYDEDYWD